MWDEFSTMILIGAFLAASAVIFFSGLGMTGLADRLADRTGLGEAIIGGVLLGAAASLSGIIVSITAALDGRASLAFSKQRGRDRGADPVPYDRRHVQSQDKSRTCRGRSRQRFPGHHADGPADAAVPCAVLSRVHDLSGAPGVLRHSSRLRDGVGRRTDRPRRANVETRRHRGHQNGRAGRGGRGKPRPEHPAPVPDLRGSHAPDGHGRLRDREERLGARRQDGYRGFDRGRARHRCGDLHAGTGHDHSCRAPRRLAARGGRYHRRQHLRHVVPDGVRHLLP